MLTRRQLLFFGTSLGTSLATSLTGGLACSRPKAISWPRRSVHAGVEFIELFPRDADETSPLLVAIHGRGDRPENWVDTWRTFPARVQIALPRASTPFADGFSWFDLHDGMTDEELGAGVGAAEASLWNGIAELAGKRRVVVTGFSQGGILSFAIASRHAASVVRAFPVAGSCPGPLLPKEGVPAAPLVAFHGTTDRVLDVKWGRDAVRVFKERGNQAELHEYPGIGHTMTSAMRADLWSEILKALPQS